MTEDHYKLTLLVGLIVLASVLGILALFSHTIMPGLRTTDNATFVKSYQAIDRKIINPVFMVQFFIPLALLGLAALYAHKHRLIEAKYLYVAFACYVAAVVLTMTVNVPLNDGLKKVADTTSSGSLASARAQFNESKWLIFNHIRTVLTLGSTGLTALAMWISKTW